MAIKLKKNSGIKLAKEDGNIGLQEISLGLGWDESKGYRIIEKEVVHNVGGFLGFGTKQTREIVQERQHIGAVDLDATVLAYKQGNLVGECSYRTKNTPIMYNGNMVLKHFGDDTTGGSNKGGDDETIKVFLSNMGDFADTLYLVLNVFSAQGRGQTLDMVENAYVKVYGENKEELANFNLSENYKGQTGSIVGKVIISNGVREFIALGDGVDVRGIDDLIKVSTKY